MDKKNILLAAAVLIILAVGIAFYFYQPEPEEIIPTQSYSVEAPLENKPDINPADKANPFKSVKTNPFE
ncbi:MAG: hypothetical protein Q7S01_03955 [bacterium]|nr:hypothetical protein [bacterium]